MTVTTSRHGTITVVTLDRREVRNAVDGATAAALAAAFRDFDADDSSQVAVFLGAHGTFCAGADLKAVAAESGSNGSHAQYRPGHLLPQSCRTNHDHQTTHV